MGVIKVAIADDHKIFRKGVVLSLRPYTNIKFVQEAENGQELLDGLAASQPDVILMDLRMPLKDGIETTKVIAKQYPQIHIIALTMYEDERFVSHMMEIGANGYLLKSADPSEIKKAIVEVSAKGYYLNNFVNRILLKKSHSRTKVIPNLNTRGYPQRQGKRSSEIHLHGIHRPGNCTETGSESAEQWKLLKTA